MGAGTVLEPLVVLGLLFGGAWINRATYDTLRSRTPQQGSAMKEELDSQDEDFEKPHHLEGRSLLPSLLPSQESTVRMRELRFSGFHTTIQTPNTAVFRNRLVSRWLRKFPFLIEAWYWALIYWVYQLGRAFSALTIAEGTVNVARKHALQVIAVEKRLHIFWELPIQKFFMSYPIGMRYINWLYSFIHIPGTIAFLVWLYYYTITSDRSVQFRLGEVYGSRHFSKSGAVLYEARRRTMALCNLFAFIVFTVWPCMPPRLLGDKDVVGAVGEQARSYGFVDTVHGEDGAASIWTSNKFCNLYAAMPSLHFGYSILVGVTIMTIPLTSQHNRGRKIPLLLFNQSHPSLAPSLHIPSTRRIICLVIGFLYPFSILVAIVSTANHFILDAVAGATVCIMGWNINSVLLNLLPVEDYFLWYLRIHKPSHTRQSDRAA